MMSLPVKNAFGKDITPNYAKHVVHVEQILAELEGRRGHCRDMAEVRRLKLQQLLQLKSCERDAEQVMWNHFCQLTKMLRYKTETMNFLLEFHLYWHYYDNRWNLLFYARYMYMYRGQTWVEMKISVYEHKTHIELLDNCSSCDGRGSRDHLSCLEALLMNKIYSVLPSISAVLLFYFVPITQFTCKYHNLFSDSVSNHLNYL